jgi:hypothetical protein
MPRSTSCKSYVALLALTLAGCSMTSPLTDPPPRDLGPARADAGDASVPSDASCVVDCGAPRPGCTVEVIDCTCFLRCPDAGPLPTDAGPVLTCDAATESLRAEMYGELGNCVTLVRLDYTTLSFLGWQLFCRPFSSSGGSDVSTETRARAVAVRETGHGGAQLSTDPSYLRVFYESPGDFGGTAVIGTQVRQSVFGGGIVWSGRGEISSPLTFRAPGELVSNCAPPTTWPDSLYGRVASYDLGTSGGAPLPTATLRAVLTEVARTPVFAAAWAGGYVFETDVLIYARSVGSFDPASAEYVVLIASGWLGG